MNRTPDLLFEKFEIETVIKKDAYSAVYLATHIFLGKRIFLKTLTTTGLNDTTLLQRFKREAKILARLEHPHIIRVLDFGTFEDQFYISFEYFESRNLRTWLQKGSLTIAQKEYLLAQLAQALQFAHEHGVIHRDLKPENILISDNLHLKIADFGLALWNEESTITEAGSIVGTPAYMSPEQIRGETLNHQTDLFNLGIITYEMFLGKNPFLGRDAGQTLNNILNFDADSLRRSYEHLPQNIVRILDGLLVKTRQERFGQARDVLTLLPFKETLPQAPFVSHGKSILKAIVFIALPLFLLLLAVIFWQERVQKKAVKPVKNVARSSALRKPVVPPDSTVREAVRLKKSATKRSRKNLGPSLPSAGPEAVKGKAESAGNERKPALVKGRLWIECLPWAQVKVDSAPAVVTPLKSALNVTAGWHRLWFRHPAFPPYEMRVQVPANGDAFVKIKLDTLFGFLDCQVFPWGTVYVDGKLVDVSPLKKPLPLSPGTHVLQVKNPRYPLFVKHITLQRGDTVRVAVHFGAEQK